MTKKRSVFLLRLNILKGWRFFAWNLNSKLYATHKRLTVATYYLAFALTLLTALVIGTLAEPGNGQTYSTANATEVLQSSDTHKLLQQGRNLYNAGKFTEAAMVGQQAANAFEAQGDVLNQAMALNLLSLTYQELGQWKGAIDAIDQSLQILQPEKALKIPNDNRSKSILAQALNARGHVKFFQGQAQEALSNWEQAAAIYQQVGDGAGMNGSLLNVARALQSLGLYERELQLLTEVRETINKQPDSLLKADTLLALGDVLRRGGDLDQSQQVLQQSLEMAKQLQSPQAIGESLLALGNTARADQNAKAALEFYAQATATSAPITKIQAQLNQLSLLLDEERISTARGLWSQIKFGLSQLPPNRTTLYAQINFASSLVRLRQTTSRGVADWSEIGKLLASAVRQAKSLGDEPAQAYALGELGRLYEVNEQLSEAQDLTQQALFKAQVLNAPDIAYRWQWQLGRILKAKGQTKDAIAVYNEAVKTLQSLRSDLVNINTDVQFTFRKSVEPVYRQLVGLLLTSTGTVEPTQQNIAKSLEVMELLQLAELDHFFGDTCSSAASGSSVVKIDSVDPTAAVIQPIILADRLEVILSLPGQPLRRYSTAIPQSKVESTVAQVRQALVTLRPGRSYITETLLPLSQQLYDCLIRPAATELASNKVKTLVFVLDGSLRNIPMGVLHDGQQYLLEKYAIALNPGQQLLTPKPLASVQLKVFTAGLTEARQGFSALPAVADELKQIKSELPAVVFLNQEFTTEAIQEELKSAAFPVVHLATHGEFGSKAEKTFILTWDGRLNINEIEKVLKARDNSVSNAIELLVFSACQTAQGDDRAALGLAGMAVRAGARSTLATLWAVSDEATAAVMSEFYRELANNKVSKAEALRLAQVALLKQPQFQHPLFWAAYVLVGNWL